MPRKDRVIRGVKEGDVGEVAVFPVEVGVRIQVRVREVSVEAKRHHQTPALDMNRVAHHILFHDQLSSDSSHTVYRQICRSYGDRTCQLTSWV